MQILLYVVMYASVLALGYVISTNIFSIRSVVAKLSFGLLLSTAVLTYFQFLLYAVFNVSFTALSVWMLFALCWVVFFLLYKPGEILKRYRHFSLRVIRKYFRSFSFVEKTLLFCIVLIVTFRFIANAYWPIVDWDALALYDYRAKVFAYTGTMTIGIERGYFLHYPLYTSLLHTWNYLIGLSEAKTWYAVLFAAFIGGFYTILRKETSRKIALLGSLFVAVNQTLLVHAGMAYTNLPYSVFLCLGYLLLLDWIRKGKRPDLLLGATFIAFSTWVRVTEPFWMISVLLLIIGFIRWRKDVPFILMGFALIWLLKYPWLVFAARVAGQTAPSIIPSYYVDRESSVGFSIVIQRISEVITFFFLTAYPLLKPYMVSLTIALGFAVYKKDKKFIFNFVIFMIFLGSIAAGIFLFSFQFPGWAGIPDSAARMSMFLVPFAIYLLMTSRLWVAEKS